MTAYERAVEQQILAERTASLLKVEKDRKAALEKELEQKRRQELAAAEREADAKIERENVARIKEISIINRKQKITFSRAIGAEICRRIAAGEMLVSICADHTMPTFDRVQEWLEDSDNTQFIAEHERAIKMRDKVFEDETIIIADDSSNDYVDKVNSKTGETFRVLDQEALTRSKMRIDARLRIMKANNPSRWSDNPNTSEINKQLLRDMRPQVLIQFVEAPSSFVKGDDAKVIVQQADTIASKTGTLDERDLKYLEDRAALLKKEKVA